MHNFVLFIRQPVGWSNKSEISSKAGNMYLNRLCIDEDASFELCRVFDLGKVLCNIPGRTFKGKVNYCECGVLTENQSWADTNKSSDMSLCETIFFNLGLGLGHG